MGAASKVLAYPVPRRGGAACERNAALAHCRVGRLALAGPSSPPPDGFRRQPGLEHPAQHDEEGSAGWISFSSTGSSAAVPECAAVRSVVAEVMAAAGVAGSSPAASIFGSISANVRDPM